MLSNLLKAIGTIAVFVLPVVVAYFLGRSIPDVRYTLSEKIPISFSNSNNQASETVQQLVVKNVGSAEARKLVVKINAPILSYSIEKYSEADDVQVFNAGTPFEIVYADLPPQALFTLVFKSTGNGVTNSAVLISHNSGTAQEALAGSEPGLLSSLPVWLLSVLSIIYFLLNVFSVRDSAISLWKSRKSRLVPKDLMHLGKPWYVRDQQWSALYAEVLVSKINQDRLYDNEDIRSSSSYELLSTEKPPQIANTDWDGVIDRAINRLYTQYSTLLNNAYEVRNLNSLVQLPKPSHFPDDKWNELRDKMSKKMVSLIDSLRFSRESILEGIKEARPDSVHDEDWAKRNQVLKLRYYEDLFNGTATANEPTRFLGEHDISVLDEKAKERLMELAYTVEKIIKFPSPGNQEEVRNLLEKGKPEWMSDSEFALVKMRYQSMTRLDSQISEYNELSRLLGDVLNDRQIGDVKPTSVSESDWKRLKHLEEQQSELIHIRELDSRTRSAQQQLEVEQQALESLKSKVSRQLKLINELLNDPTMIDRIEEYDTTFSPGNLSNLRQVATRLKERARSE